MSILKEACIKCGSRFAKVRWIPGWASVSFNGEVVFRNPKVLRPDAEEEMKRDKLVVRCMNCEYFWTIPPLDRAEP